MYLNEAEPQLPHVERLYHPLFERLAEHLDGQPDRAFYQDFWIARNGYGVFDCGCTFGHAIEFLRRELGLENVPENWAGLSDLGLQPQRLAELFGVTGESVEAVSVALFLDDDTRKRVEAIRLLRLAARHPAGLPEEVPARVVA